MLGIVSDGREGKGREDKSGGVVLLLLLIVALG